MTDQTKKELDYILDTFTGADGGGRFIRFQSLVEEMDRQAEGDDLRQAHTAKMVLDKSLSTFKRFIELAQEQQ